MVLCEAEKRREGVMMLTPQLAHQPINLDAPYCSEPPEIGVPETPTSSGFDYSGLSPDDANSLQRSAQRIRSLVNKGNGVIAELGSELIVAKEKLPHGQFARWVEAEFGVSDRTALNYMRFAEWAADKSEIVSVLQPNTVYLLAAPSTPQSVQDAVIERIRSGETLGANAIRTMVLQAKEEAKEAARLAELSPKQREREERREERRRKRDERLDEELEQRTRVAAEFLLDRLGLELRQFLILAQDIDWLHLYRFVRLPDPRLEREDGAACVATNDEVIETPTQSTLAIEPDAVAAERGEEPNALENSPSDTDESPAVDPMLEPERNDPESEPEQVAEPDEVDEPEQVEPVLSGEVEKAVPPITAPKVEQPELEQSLSELDQATLRVFQEHYATGGSPWIGVHVRNMRGIDEDAVHRLAAGGYIVQSRGNPDSYGIRVEEPERGGGERP
jgi:hypothetical protein